MLPVHWLSQTRLQLLVLVLVLVLFVLVLLVVLVLVGDWLAPPFGGLLANEQHVLATKQRLRLGARVRDADGQSVPLQAHSRLSLVPSPDETRNGKSAGIDGELRAKADPLAKGYARGLDVENAP